MRTDCTVIARVAIFAALSISAGACAARTSALGRAEPPPLEIPAVPPRVIGTVADEDQTEAEAGQPAAPETAGIPGSRSNRSGARTPAKPNPSSAKGEVPAPDAPAPKPEAPVELRTVDQPPPLLRTPQVGDDQQSERKIRETLTRASSALLRVNYAALNADAKAQYDTAKRFIEQAGEALKQKNYVFADYLAGKAETLAQQLLGGR